MGATGDRTVEGPGRARNGQSQMANTQRSLKGLSDALRGFYAGIARCPGMEKARRRDIGEASHAIAEAIAYMFDRVGPPGSPDRLAAREVRDRPEEPALLLHIGAQGGAAAKVPVAMLPSMARLESAARDIGESVTLDFVHAVLESEPDGDLAVRLFNVCHAVEMVRDSVIRLGNSLGTNEGVRDADLSAGHARRPEDGGPGYAAIAASTGKHAVGRRG